MSDTHERVVAAIERIRRDDSDFITPDTIRAYTTCTTEEARAGIVAVFGQDWLDRQDRAQGPLFVLSAQPIDERGVIDTEGHVEFVGRGANAIIENVAFHDWMEARQPGEAWDLTLEVRS